MLQFFQLSRDASDIHRFPTLHMVETHFLLENLWISWASLGILEKFQCSSVLPNVKYNCAVLFWSQFYWLFIYASKYIFLYKKNFLIDTHTKIWTEITDIIVFRKKLLKFLQGDPEKRSANTCILIR